MAFETFLEQKSFICNFVLVALFCMVFCCIVTIVKIISDWRDTIGRFGEVAALLSDLYWHFPTAIVSGETNK